MLWFALLWLGLVPGCVVMALAFSSVTDIDDLFHKDYNSILKDFKPSWHVFVAEWWLQQAGIEWAAEFFLLGIGFMYSRSYNEEEFEDKCLDEVRSEWLEHHYFEKTPLNSHTDNRVKS